MTETLTKNLVRTMNATISTALSMEVTLDNSMTSGVHYFLEVTVLSVLTPFIILGNSATMIAFWKMPGLTEKVSNLVILSLACADLGIGLELMMVLPSRIAGHWLIGKTGCQVSVFLLNVFIISGIFTTASISLDRYLLISKAYPEYLKIQSRRKINITISVIWLYALTMGFVTIILWDLLIVPGIKPEGFDYGKECSSPLVHVFIPSAIFFMLNIFLPLVAIEVLSLSFVIKLRHKLKVSPALGVVSQPQSDGSLQKKSNMSSHHASKLTFDLPASARASVGHSGPDGCAKGTTALPVSSQSNKSSQKTSNKTEAFHCTGMLAIDMQASTASPTGRSGADALQKTPDTPNYPLHAGKLAFDMQASTNDSTVGPCASAIVPQKRYLKAATTMGALVIVLNLCLLPYILYSLITSLFCPECTSGTVRDMLMYVVRLNSFVNPILYAATMSKIRLFYKKIFSKI